MPRENKKNFDIVLIGGGPVGFVFAATMAKENPNIKIALVERQPLAAIKSGKQKDHRTTTLSAHTCELLDTLGLWHKLADQSVAIKTIEVNDQNAPASNLSFDHHDVGKPFGYTINNTFLRSTIASAFEELPNLTIYDGAILSALDRTKGKITAQLNEGQDTLSAHLLVGADGRFSQVRQHFNFDFHCKPYNQSALIGLVDHDMPHGGLAFESFYPSGPTAFLPYQNTEGEEVTSALVLCGKAAELDALSNDPSFALQLLKERAPTQFGTLKKLYNCQVYPLEVGKARKVYQDRVVLVGDAAQYMHPVAGQGMNLGIRDAKTLGEHLVKMARLGLDIGAATTLIGYQQQRQSDVWPMLGLTHGLIRLFGLKNPAATFARRLGFQLVDKLPFAKRFFMHRAMGYEVPLI